MKQHKRHHNTYRDAGHPSRGQPDRHHRQQSKPLVIWSKGPIITAPGPYLTEFRDNNICDGGGDRDNENPDSNLLDELQALLRRLGAANISITFYLIEFGGLPRRVVEPLLQEAAGTCAMLRTPTRGHYLVIYLGPEPSPGNGGFSGRLHRGLKALAPTASSECAWAEVRMLRRCNHDITEPTHLLLDLNAAAPRVIGITGW